MKYYFKIEKHKVLMMSVANDTVIRMLSTYLE